MATVGSIVINLAMNTAGLSAGVAQATAQLSALEARILGTGTAAGSSAAGFAKLQAAENSAAVAAYRLSAAHEAQRVATENMTISNLRLSELLARRQVQMSQVVSAQANVRRSTVAMAQADQAAAIASSNLARAQAALAAARTSAAAPAVANMAKDFSMVSTAAMLAGYAILAFGASSAKVAASFEYEMLMIQTQAGMSAAQVREISAAVLEMAPTVQTTPMELARGIFHIASVGYDAAKSMNILETAAKGAAVGNADLEDVTNALVATVVSGISDVQGFNNGITNMGRAMGVVNGIVGAGNMRMQGLVASMSSGVLATAQQFGVSIQHFGAAMAALTDMGVPPEEAATRLRITIAMLGAPVRIAERELAKIGLTSRSLADEMRGPAGLIGALALLQEHMDGAGLDAVQQSQLLKTAFGGSRSSAGILSLIGAQDLLLQKLDVISRKGEQFGADYAAESETATASFRNFGAAVEVLQIKLGNTMLPVLEMIAKALAMVAGHSEIVIPLFLLLAGVITGMAVKAAVGFAVSIGQIIAQMVFATASSFALSGAFTGISVSTGTAASGLGAAATAAAGAGASAAGAAASLSSLGLASAGAAAPTGPLVAGYSAASGAMAATASATGPLIAGLQGASGAVAATTASTGPLVAGFAGAGGAMAATAGSTGALVAGLAGANGAIAATAASTGPLIVGTQTATGAQAALAASTTPVIVGLNGQAIAMGSVTAASGPMTAGVTATTGAINASNAALTGWRATMMGAIGTTGVLGMAIGALALPITLIVAAGALLLLNWDRVGQGVRVVVHSILGGIKMIFDAASMLPGVGDAFKGLSESISQAQAGLAADMATMEARIAEEAAKSGTAGIEAMMEEVKAKAEAEFRDLNMTLIDLYGTGLAGAQMAAQDAGAKDMAAYAQGIRDAQDAPLAAMKAFQERMANQVSESAEIARLVGQLQSMDMMSGLVSNDAGTYAAAEAWKKSVIERLDQITGGAYTAGTDAGATWLEAFRKQMLADGANEGDIASALSKFTPDQIARLEQNYKVLGETWKRMAPSAQAASAAYQDLIRSLESGTSAVSQAAQQAKSDLTSAFNEIKAKAMEYFDALHDKNMQAISDARDHKNALLDAKAELNQAPVTAAQKALDFQRQAIQEWRLRQAVAQATTPESQRDAVLALQDFLAQKHIDMMQDQVDVAEEAINKQREANNDAFDEQVKAENKRFQQQKKAFARELEALERYLRAHPGEWQKANNKVLKLLAEYGVDYAAAGTLLGSEFTSALTEQLKKVEEALRIIKESIKDVVEEAATVTLPTGTGLPPGFHLPYGGMFASGAWNLGHDQIATVHAREMILRPDVAGAIRGMVSTGRGQASLPRLVALGIQAERSTAGRGGPVAMPFAPGRREVGSMDLRLGSADVAPRGGSAEGLGGLTVQIGEEKLAEIMDKSLHASTAVYGRRGSVRLKSRR